jgi:hypothetical protein
MTLRVSLICLLLAAMAATGLSAPGQSFGFHVKFLSQSGGVIELDTGKGTLRTPHGGATRLYSCGDNYQVCFTDHHGFAFANFRHCDNVTTDSYSRLKFHPRVVATVENNTWVVYDASPNYLFHYTESNGLVGIYVGATRSFDFRSVLHDPNFNLAAFDAAEFRIQGSAKLAACNEE